MTNLISSTSYYNTDLFCVTCESQLIDAGRACPACHTPIQVSRSFSNQGYRGKLVSVVGAASSGKTVFLGMLLDMLSKGANGLRGVPNGSFSIEIQDQTISAFERRRFPEKTPSEFDKWKWVHCEAFDEKKPKLRIEIITPDVAGEVLAMELEQANTSSTIRNLIAHSKGMIVLLDSQLIRDDARSVDVFGVKLASYVADLHARKVHERRRHVRIPIAFVLTKTDCCPDAKNNTHLFVETNLPGLSQFCRERMQSFEFFSASVVSETLPAVDRYGSEFQVPMQVQPRGILEPMDWVLGRLEKKWRRSK